MNKRRLEDTDGSGRRGVRASEDSDTEKALTVRVSEDFDMASRWQLGREDSDGRVSHSEGSDGPCQ